MEYRIFTSLRRYFLINLLIAFAIIYFYISANGSIKIDKNDIIGLIILVASFIGILGLIFFIGKFLSIGEIKVIMDDQGLNLSWIRQSFLFFKVDRYIKWSDIKSYEINLGNQFSHKFIIRTKLDKSFSFQHLDFDNKDDFNKFILDFEKGIIFYNQNRESK